MASKHPRCEPKLIPVLVVLSVFLAQLSVASDWGYTGANGPSSWAAHYPECGGRRQSPINVDTRSRVQVKPPPHIRWMFYNPKPDTVTLINNGHTVQLKAVGKQNKTAHFIVGSKTFQLDQTHFHWGRKNSEGSEHRFNNISFPLEMHAVHRLVQNGQQVSPPEVVVITLLFELAKQKNPGLERFIHSISAVKGAGTEVEIIPFPPSALIPTRNNNFYQYEGSLTTPPCSQVVTFFIRRETAKVSPEQLEMFRLALNEEGEEMSGNFRPIQPLNGRKVTFVRV